MNPVLLICLSFLANDGDSGRCTTASGEYRIRLAGIDAGEIAPFTRCRQRPDVWACSPIARSTAGAARTRARELAADGAVCRDQGGRSWDRVVARCTVNGRDLGAVLVREGLARSDPDFGDQYRAEETYARIQRRGVWR